MDLSALIVVIVGTLLFIGFAVFMAFFSRRSRDEASQSEAAIFEKEKLQ